MDTSYNERKVWVRLCVTKKRKQLVEEQSSQINKENKRTEYQLELTNQYKGNGGRDEISNKHWVKKIKEQVTDNLLAKYKEYFSAKSQSCLISLQPSVLFITPSSLTLLPPLASKTLLSYSFPLVSLTIPSQPPSPALQPLFTSIASILLGFALQPLSVDSLMVVSLTYRASGHHLPWMTPKLCL